MNNDKMKDEERYRKERLLFRFVNLGQQQVDELRVLWRNETEVSSYKDTGNFVVTVELQEDIDYTALIAFVKKQALPESSYGLYCSLVTENSVDGIRVPRFAAQLFRQTGGTIDFSCTGV